MRIGWVGETTEEALRTGSKAACVFAELSPVLEKQCELRIYNEPAAVSIIARERESRSDVLIVHLEDRPANVPFRKIIAGLGGVAWCHDWFERDADARPEIREVLGGAAAVLFTSVRNLAEYRSSGGRGGDYLPYPASAFFLGGNPENRLAIACASSPCAEDQVHDVLASLRAAARETPFLWLVAPGEEDDAKRLRLEYPELEIEIVPGRTPENWRRALERSAVAVHLHFSAYGDPGPLFPLTLMSGVPALVSDFGEIIELDSSAFIRVPPGDAQRGILEETFRRLRQSPEAPELRLARTRGRELGSELFDSRRVCAELLRLCESVASGRIRSDIPGRPGKIEAACS